MHQDNYGVYGARKVLALNREGIGVARCMVERLRHERGLQGVRRGGATRRATIADPTAARPADLVGRPFTPRRPDATWVVDFPYVATWSGTVYVFVLDAFSWRVLGWRAATSMATDLVVDALEMAIWARGRQGVLDLSGLVHHSDARSQYT